MEFTRIETPLGALIVKPAYDSDGIWIDLRRTDADQDAPLVLIEYTEDEADLDGGHIITRVWQDCNDDEYENRIVHTGIEEFFAMEEVEYEFIKMPNGALFEDFDKNDDGVYWSRICKNCAEKFSIPVNLLDESGQGVCSIQGCQNEADYYIDFPEGQFEVIKE